MSSKFHICSLLAVLLLNGCQLRQEQNGAANVAMASIQLTGYSKPDNMRTIKKLHKAVYSPIDDLITYRAMPTGSIRYLDPFLFLNHHGPQRYGPNNNGLPFGPHPHRGFETVTIVYDGELEHRDSTGAGGTIGPGDVQWMTAAGGILHEEFHSNSFAEKGGNMEMVQLWVNLPAKHKNAEPGYQTLLAKDIPSVELPGKAGTVRVIAGDFDGDKGPARTFTPINLSNGVQKGPPIGVEEGPPFRII